MSLWWKYRWIAGKAMFTIVESRNARKAPKAATSNTAVDDGWRRLRSRMGSPTDRWLRLVPATAFVLTTAAPRPPLLAMSTPIRAAAADAVDAAIVAEQPRRG